jgi:hypothetical protein
MYCPQCGTQLAPDTISCQGCDLDVRPFARMLVSESAATRQAEHPSAVEQVRHWERQRHPLGLLLVLCSLLVGCFIPICIGVFSGYAGLSALIMVLAGLAGVLLVLGTMLILASEGTILVSTTRKEAPVERSPRPGYAPALLSTDIHIPDEHQDEPLPEMVRR